MIIRHISTLFSLMLAAPAVAQDAPPPDIDPDAIVGDGLAADDLNRDRITVALGIATVPSYEGSDHHNRTLAAFARGTVGGYAFELRERRLYLDAIRNRPGPRWDLQLGPVAGLNRDRTRRRRIDDPRVVSLGDRRTAIELGGFAGLGKTGVLTSPFDKLTASVTVLHDVNAAHRSTLVVPALDYGTPLSPRAFAGLSLSATHVGDRYAATYFSVPAPTVGTAALPAFAARGGWKDWSLSAVVTHALTGDLLHGLGVGAGLRYRRLLNDAARSPVTAVAGDRDQWSGTVGLTYTF